jgi:hypothetical protein
MARPSASSLEIPRTLASSKSFSKRPFVLTFTTSPTFAPMNFFAEALLLIVFRAMVAVFSIFRLFCSDQASNFIAFFNSIFRVKRTVLFL